MITITRNEPEFNLELMSSYVGAVNSAPFHGLAPGQARIAGISANKQVENVIASWSVTYRIDPEAA